MRDRESQYILRSVGNLYRRVIAVYILLVQIVPAIFAFGKKQQVLSIGAELNVFRGAFQDRMWGL